MKRILKNNSETTKKIVLMRRKWNLHVGKITDATVQNLIGSMNKKSR